MESQRPGRAGADAGLLEAIESIYACVTDPAGFERLPETLAPLLRASSVTIWCTNTDLVPAVFSNWGLDESQVRDYLDNWAGQDPLIPIALRSFLGHSATPDQMIGERAFQQLPVFEGHYSPKDIARPMGNFDFVDAGWLGGLVSERGRSDPPVTSDDRERLATLARHLRRAWSIALRMGLLSARVETAESLLSACRLATWLIDGQRRVHAANPAAEHMMAMADSGIMHDRGSIRFAHADVEAAFDTAVQRLEAGQRGPVEVPLPSEHPRTIAWGALVPIERDRRGAGAVESMYMLALARTGTSNDIDWRQLQRRLPISRTEADVLARLMRAEEPTAIAEARGSRHETIRGYEKSLRTKLDCNSRAQLVACGWRTVAAIPFVDSATGESAVDPSGS